MSSNPSGEDLRDALDAVAAFIPRYVVLPSAEAVDALALWAAATHLITDRWPAIFPPLIVTSADKRSGKTRVLDVLEPMTAEPWRIGCAPSAATLYRVEDQVTCLLDEVDRVFGRAQENDLLISIINDGWRRGAEVRRCDEKNQVRVFSAFAPRVLCGIDAGRWPDTVTDRSIIIKLTRKPPTQLLEDWEGYEAETHTTSHAAAKELGETLAALAPLGELAGQHRIARLVELDDRANDCWNPLRQLAEVAGGNWPERARLAAITLSAERGDEDTLKATLLRDLRELFGDRAQVPTAELIDGLLALEEGPWRKVGRGGMDANLLARMLRSYGVRSKTIRQGEVTCKGYTAADLAPIFSAYLAPPRNSRNAVTINNGGARAVAPDSPAVTELPATAGSDARVTALRHKGGDEGPPPAQSLRERAAGFLVLAEEEVER